MRFFSLTSLTSLAFFLFDLAIEGDKLLRADSVVLQKDGRVPRVLAGDDVAFLQDAYGAVSDVLEVSYRRADQVDDAFFSSAGLLLFIPLLFLFALDVPLDGEDFLVSDLTHGDEADSLARTLE